MYLIRLFIYFYLDQLILIRNPLYLYQISNITLLFLFSLINDLPNMKEVKFFIKL
jgi:hypothetical protein